VIIATRSAERASAAISTLKSETGNPNVSFLELDLASLASVRRAAAALPPDPLDALVLNAGIGGTASDGTETSAEGFERIWATNHLGHFVFANLIRDRLSPTCRIAVVASNMHNPPPQFTGGVPVRYPGAEALSRPDPARVSPVMRYSLSKLCNIYFTYELARRIAGSEIRVNAFNPGLMLDSEFHKLPISEELRRVPNAPVAVSGRQLAELVIAPEWREVNARYVNRGVVEESSELSKSVENAKELWEVSVRLGGLAESF
jgi:NAD(P)-dependent dehydrogenase (short-subunit alcohol dehydrogenase family)